MARSRSAHKSESAFRTISEVSDHLQIPQHVLRFWETKFSQVQPMKRGGGRRYYRPEDIELLRRIRDCLYADGYTIKGVQKLLREGQLNAPTPPQVNASPATTTTSAATTFASERVQPDTDQAEPPASENVPAPAEMGDATVQGASASAHLSDAARRELEDILHDLKTARATLEQETPQPRVAA